MNVYPAEFKERAVKLAVESEQPIAQTARDLGLNENTLHTWIGQYHRAERQTQHSPRHSILAHRQFWCTEAEPVHVAVS
jgi:transposase